MYSPHQTFLLCLESCNKKKIRILVSFWLCMNFGTNETLDQLTRSFRRSVIGDNSVASASLTAKLGNTSPNVILSGHVSGSMGSIHRAASFFWLAIGDRTCFSYSRFCLSTRFRWQSLRCTDAPSTTNREVNCNDYSLKRRTCPSFEHPLYLVPVFFWPSSFHAPPSLFFVFQLVSFYSFEFRRACPKWKR